MQKFHLQVAGAQNSLYPALTTAAMTSQPVGPGRTASVTDHKWEIVWASDTTTGAVQIETAVSEDYTGAWDPVAPEVVWSAASHVDVVTFRGHLGATRVRATVTIDGAGVTVYQSGVRN